MNQGIIKMFENVRNLREKHREEMKIVVKKEVTEYVQKYLDDNENIVLIKIQGDDYMNDDGEEKKIVYVKVEVKDDKWLLHLK